MSDQPLAGEGAFAVQQNTARALMVLAKELFKSPLRRLRDIKASDSIVAAIFGESRQNMHKRSSGVVHTVQIATVQRWLASWAIAGQEPMALIVLDDGIVAVPRSAVEHLLCKSCLPL